MKTYIGQVFHRAPALSSFIQDFRFYSASAYGALNKTIIILRVTKLIMDLSQNLHVLEIVISPNQTVSMDINESYTISQPI